jgi:hypothetical protein
MNTKMIRRRKINEIFERFPVLIKYSTHWLHFLDELVSEPKGSELIDSLVELADFITTYEFDWTEVTLLSI